MTIQCPECKRPIEDDEAILCLYCGASLRRSAGFLGHIRYPGNKFILIGIVLVVIVSFIILIYLR